VIFTAALKLLWIRREFSFDLLTEENSCIREMSEYGSSRNNSQTAGINPISSFEQFGKLSQPKFCCQTPN
jgi:hypothetical protein